MKLKVCTIIKTKLFLCVCPTFLLYESWKISKIHRQQRQLNFDFCYSSLNINLANSWPLYLQHCINQLFYEFFQVVVAMRDLFQVVFELKQKEIDDALRKMDKDKRVINSYKQLPYNSVSSTQNSRKNKLSQHLVLFAWF